MIFYEVLGTSAAPACLVGTQADARKLARERGTSWEQVDVPTDKAGLMDYINRLKADVSAEMHRPLSRDEILHSNSYEAQAAARHLMDPDHKPAFTQVQVDAMFAPIEHDPKQAAGWGAGLRATGDRVDLICDEIGELSGYHLGNVATAVSCRFAELARGTSA